MSTDPLKQSAAEGAESSGHNGEYSNLCSEPPPHGDGDEVLEGLQPRQEVDLAVPDS